MKLYRLYISVNREVKLFKTQGRDNGEIIDIKINGLCGTNELNLYIEVKCCWNKLLESDLEEELAKRYVLKRNCNYGIYVIGWFGCKQWILDSDTRKLLKYNLEEAKKKFNDKFMLHYIKIINCGYYFCDSHPLILKNQ
ncbi:TPA: hypothetical protein KOO02_003149 [Clostridioides difficile]|nr:hypothetical protein [Clostridioides difficile]HBF4536895.1 hypothetical protein [Clostridioides difficile]HBF4844286.1 hypothetical protein [Clostridioides difficile]HBF5073223.1 hypothetical protein [Clostridioides difficile]HBF5084809.1 hypothetical protein [Clostridioides difficile]